MASYNEEREFALNIFGNILDDVVDWVKSNLEPEQVFSEDQLKEWAEENGYVQSEELTNK